MVVDTIVDVQIGNQCHFYVFEIFYKNKYIFLNYWKLRPKYCYCISELFKNMFEKNPIEKKKQADKLEKETLPRFLKQMLAIRQQSSGSFLVGNDVSRYQKISNINYRGNNNDQPFSTFYWSNAIFIFLWIQLTWADIALATFLDTFLPKYHIDGISRFSLLTELMHKVQACDKIKTYMDAQKATAF